MLQQSGSMLAASRMSILQRAADHKLRQLDERHKLTESRAAGSNRILHSVVQICTTILTQSTHTVGNTQ